MVALLIAGFTALIAWMFSVIFKRRSNYPPGPTPYPIIGSMFQMTGNASEWLTTLGKKYGRIFSIKLGSYEAIVLNDYELVKEAFKDDRFNGRPSNVFFKLRNEGNNGILFADGPAYQEIRRFTLRHLRDFGFGKSSLESTVVDEIRQLEENMRKHDGQLIDLKNKFNLSVLNALWTISTGERFSLDDSRASSVIERLTTMVQSGGPARASRFLPILNYIWPPAKKTLAMGLDLLGSVKEILNESIVSHRKSFEAKDDFISVFLQEGKNSAPGSPFHGEGGIVQLRIVLLDLFVAGAETTSTTLTWFFLLIAVHPEAQSKIHKEIDEFVGRDRKPGLDDRPNLKYTEACIQETLRYVGLVPMISHSTSEEIPFHGYTIPKDTMIFANIYAALHDPAVWERPGEFYPEHFLSGAKVPDGFMPFGTGKRVCLGETLARMELYLFVTHLLHSFTFAVKDGTSPSLEPVNYNSIVRSPRPYELLIKTRF